MVLAGLFFSGILNSATFIIIVVAVFFLASSGASAAYLTASEIFPMETRALAIAFFYAIGTAVGGIIGPLLFGKLIATSHKGPVAIAFLIAAGVMALGGIAELFFGVKAEGEQLEDIAKPLTAEGADGDSGTATGSGSQSAGGPDRSAANRARAQAGEERGEAMPGEDAVRTRQDTAARRAGEDRPRARLGRIRTRERSGLRRYRPGPGRISGSPGIGVSMPLPPQPLRTEVQAIEKALDEHGGTDRRELARMVGARYWGPGVFREALRKALADGSVRRTSRSTYAPRRADEDHPRGAGETAPSR